MGAWGYGSVENDDALDWLHELYQSCDVSVIRSALSRAVEPHEDFFESRGFRALAAAEVIAGYLGHPAPGQRCASLADWAREHLSITPDLVSLAREALASTKARWSHEDFWVGQGDDARAKWFACIGDLESRLA